ncbi:MAG TPA: M14 metallopeptidase family protein [Gemmatimonadaceae bacterium]|nr:M14 metallopeptidase family protein [Gemmatimonadaceae bacterium]
MIHSRLRMPRLVSRAARGVLVPVAALAFLAPAAAAQRVTSPKEHFGFDIGDDYRLATYTQFADYWRKLDAESDRMQVEEIGRTAEGRPQLMAIITAPENFAQLARYQAIAARLAKAQGVDSAEARRLAKEGKAVVWIDGGLHATEVLGAHQLIETVHHLVSRNDEEMQRILRDVIVLAVHANPDGMELVSSWYMKEQDSTKRAMNIPRLYQKYVGHDNNRDFYAATQPESQNMNRVLYREWYPQIMYNHHQTGPAGTVMFAPPFRDPHNHNYDPLIVTGLDVVGSAMHNRFVSEEKPGVVMRSAAGYSTWWNGGLRTTAYFHNIIGLLTETIGNPTPMRIPLVPDHTFPRADVPFPIEPQPWHFRQSIEYELTANWAVLDVAQRNREHFLYNIWKMGSNSIERGSTDSWTVTSALVDSLRAALRARAGEGGQATMGLGGARGGGTGSLAGDTALYNAVLRDPAKRDARAYVLSADQKDFGTATKFINTLRYNGVDVHRATAAFRANGRQYPAGSYIVQTAQAFRPHILDMFEPQVHPNDFAYPGGPPKRPYDAAGWTLAYQMGVEFDRHQDPVSGPFELVEGMAAVKPGEVRTPARAAGFLLRRDANDAFAAVNRLLKAGAKVHALRSPMTSGNRTYEEGTFYIAGAPAGALADVARTLGVSFDGTRTARPSSAVAIAPKRIALWDTYGGSMPSGWTRFLLEQFGYDFDVVYPQDIDAGNLNAKYDVVILPAGAYSTRGESRRADTTGIPAEYRRMLGRLTPEHSAPTLRQFLEAGGTVITIGSSTSLAYTLGLPVANQLVTQETDRVRDLTAEEYYIPGSLLEVTVDTTAGVTAGMPRHVDVMFDESPVFKLASDAEARGVKPLAWFATATPLRSGWAWGQQYLERGVAAAEAKIGRGTLYLYGPEVLFRAQPHGTFKLVFNALTGF